jgi:cation diffusion facilitator family transporter
VGREVRAIQLAIATSIIGIVAKSTAGAITGSMSMISSAVDSGGDLIVSLANLFVVRFSDQAPDEEHNYGHAKIEGLGAMFEGGFVFAAGGFIIYEAIHKAIIGEPTHDSLIGIAVMVPLVALTIGTVLHLRRVARATGSLVIKADALHYATDVYVNLGVLASLALVALTGQPLFDTAISIAIALYMLGSSLHVVREGFDVVMDGKIPHVDFHVVVDPDMTARQVHDLYMDLRARIRARVGPSTKVLMHADPAPSRAAT